MIDCSRYTSFTGTVRTAEEGALRLDSVADDLAAAMHAGRSELLNCALKAIEHVTPTAGDDLEA